MISNVAYSCMIAGLWRTQSVASVTDASIISAVAAVRRLIEVDQTINETLNVYFAFQENPGAKSATRVMVCDSVGG